MGEARKYDGIAILNRTFDWAARLQSHWLIVFLTLALFPLVLLYAFVVLPLLGLVHLLNRIRSRP
jgi:hypothetical protein